MWDVQPNSSRIIVFVVMQILEAFESQISLWDSHRPNQSEWEMLHLVTAKLSRICWSIKTEMTFLLVRLRRFVTKNKSLSEIIVNYCTYYYLKMSLNIFDLTRYTQNGIDVKSQRFGDVAIFRQPIEMNLEVFFNLELQPLANTVVHTHLTNKILNCHETFS